ncbi:MAG: lipid-A-disaccharide synthase [bacterium]
MGDLLLVTGDSSADTYAANLISYLSNQSFDGTIYAAAGHKSKEAGAELVENVVDRAVVGISEIAGSVPYFYNLMKDLDDLLVEQPINAIVLMDFPGFNLSFAWLSRARELGIPLYYYITPQVWAWWRWRMKLLGDWFEERFVIFPFEKELFEKRGISAQFVGHPMLEEWEDDPTYDVYETMDLPRDKKIVSFFPGSRNHEVQRHLEPMIGGARRLENTDSSYCPVISAAPTVDQQFIRETLEKLDFQASIWSGDSRSLLEASELTVLASGTVTMEATFCTTPMIVGYRVSSTTYWMGRTFIKTDHIAMPNLIDDRADVPELIQSDFSSENIYRTAHEMMKDRVKRKRQKEVLQSIRDTFGSRTPSQEVGDFLLNV